MLVLLRYPHPPHGGHLPVQGVYETPCCLTHTAWYWIVQRPGEINNHEPAGGTDTTVQLPSSDTLGDKKKADSCGQI